MDELRTPKLQSLIILFNRRHRPSLLRCTELTAKLHSEEHLAVGESPRVFRVVVAIATSVYAPSFIKGLPPPHNAISLCSGVALPVTANVHVMSSTSTAGEDQFYCKIK